MTCTTRHVLNPLGFLSYFCMLPWWKFPCYSDAIIFINSFILDRLRLQTSGFQAILALCLPQRRISFSPVLKYLRLEYHKAVTEIMTNHDNNIIYIWPAWHDMPHVIVINLLGFLYWDWNVRLKRQSSVSKITFSIEFTKYQKSCSSLINKQAALSSL